MKKSAFLTLFLLLSSSTILRSQYSYDILFHTPQLDEIGWFVYNDEVNDQQIVLISNECADDNTSCITKHLIYTITNDGDSIRWPFIDRRNDTMFSINSLTRDNNGDYFMVGHGWTQGSNSGSLRNSFDYYTKWNNNHIQIWESIHARPSVFNPFMGSRFFKILKLINGNFLVGMTVTTVDPTYEMRYYVVEIDPNDGQVIKEKVLALGGSSSLQSLTYSFDSSEIIIHSGRIFMSDCERNTEGAVFIDTTTYDKLHTFCYNRDDDDPLKYWCVNTPYNAKFSNEGTLIVAGTGICIDATKDFISRYVFAYEYDSTFQIINRNFLTHKDTVIDAAWMESLDINDNNEIILVGNHNRGFGPWNGTYSYIYLAKLNQNLELISERYLGGDAYYTAYSMASTSDGGVVVTGTRFDYLVNDYERDAFVIKTDGGLWVGQNESSIIPVHSAIVYPNPGYHQFSLRTTEYPCILEIFDNYGQILTSQKIAQLNTVVNTSKLKPGIFFWILKKNNKIIDKGKWIKLK